MRRSRKLARLRSSCLALAVLGLFGCAGPAREPAPRPREQLTVHVPCMLSAPVQKAVADFQATRPGVAITVLVDKPVAQLAELESAGGEGAVAITLGEVEMQALVAAGAVQAEEVRAFATNPHPLVVVAPAGEGPPEGIPALTSPEVRRIFLEDPERSTLGARAEQALSHMGIWEQVRTKAVRPRPDVMVLSQMLEGGAEAAVVIKGCLFAEGGAVPKTIRILAEFPPGSSPPIIHRAAPLSRGDGSEAAKEFVEFLLSPGGRQALAGAGLAPIGER